MSRRSAMAALQRALLLSEQLVAAAQSGDVGRTISLDAERLQLLKSARTALHPMDEQSRPLLRQIAALNDLTIGLLEHRRRAKGRDMDMAAAGRRAVVAYANVGMPR